MAQRTERPHQFKMNLSTEEKAWLEEMSFNKGLASSDMFRLWLRDAWDKYKNFQSR